MLRRRDVEPNEVILLQRSQLTRDDLAATVASLRLVWEKAGQYPTADAAIAVRTPAPRAGRDGDPESGTDRGEASTSATERGARYRKRSNGDGLAESTPLTSLVKDEGDRYANHWRAIQTWLCVVRQAV